jgi:hypothetical protein
MENKSLHGKLPYQHSQNHISEEASNKLLDQGTIYGKTERFVIAIQHQVIST